MDRAETEFTRLLVAARAGDAAARARMLESVVPRLQAYVRLNAGGLVLSREWSLDVAQSVCGDALSALDAFAGTSEGEFRAWLFKIALNKVRARYRYLTAERRDARKDRPIGAGTSDSDDRQLATVYGEFASTDRPESAVESMDRIEAAMQHLNEEQRDVVTMATLLGLTGPEIAQQLGKTEAAVRKVLSRARAKLAVVIALDVGEGP